MVLYILLIHYIPYIYYDIIIISYIDMSGNFINLKKICQAVHLWPGHLMFLPMFIPYGNR